MNDKLETFHYADFHINTLELRQRQCYTPANDLEAARKNYLKINFATNKSLVRKCVHTIK